MRQFDLSWAGGYWANDAFSKADNPIVFASDGFVNVTGYDRSEVVPRNCRFLQGNYTDRNATRRLKASIEAREETVELLLNYRKNGEPFWNLLYVGNALVPEHDSHGPQSSQLLSTPL